MTIEFSDIHGGANESPNNAYGDIEWRDGNIDIDPLFDDSDNGDFHLQVESPCVDAGDPNGALDPDTTIADMGAYYLPQTHFRIPLRRGWSLLSSINQPRNSAVRSIWSDIVARGRLIMSKDASGRFYVTANNFSNMLPWDVSQGYLAKLTDADTLIITNVPVAEDKVISLHQGWNMVAYFPASEVNGPSALRNLGDNLLMPKDEAGRFYSRAAGFSNMGNLKRTKGYLVKVDHAADLVWNTQGRVQSEAREVQGDPVHFPIVELTGSNMSLLVTPPPPPPSSGGEWEVGVFTRDGLCVGSSSSSSSPIGLAVWGDDPTTEAIDGALEGEALSFRVWDGEAETPVLLKTVETTALPTVLPQGLCTLRVSGASGYGNPEAASQADQEGVCYATDGFAEVTLDVGAQGVAPVPTEFSLDEAYPNPFNGVTQITFGLPEDSNVNVGIYDLAGRLVSELASGQASAGMHSVTWNAVGVPSGLYLVKLVTPKFSATRKVTLLR